MHSGGITGSRALGCTSTANHHGRSGSPPTRAARAAAAPPPAPAASSYALRRRPRDAGRDRRAVAVRPRTGDSRRSVRRFQDFAARREEDAWLCPGIQDGGWAGVCTVDHDDARLSPEPPATGTAHLPPAPATDLVLHLRHSSATPSARPWKAAPRRHRSSWDVRSHFSTPFGSSTGPSSSWSGASPRPFPPGHSARTPSSRPSPRGYRRSVGRRALARAHRAERAAAGPLPTRSWGNTAADAPI